MWYMLGILGTVAFGEMLLLHPVSRTLFSHHSFGQSTHSFGPRIFGSCLMSSVQQPVGTPWCLLCTVFREALFFLPVQLLIYRAVQKNRNSASCTEGKWLGLSRLVCSFLVVPSPSKISWPRACVTCRAGLLFTALCGVDELPMRG